MMYRLPQKGFTLLIAVILSSVVLTVGLSLLDVAYKQVILSSTAKQSQAAFYNADSALECALFYDQQRNAFDFTTPADASTLACNSTPVTGYTTAIDPAANAPRITTYTLPCAGGGASSVSSMTTVYKYANGATALYANGYNTCNANDPRRVERGLKATYGIIAIGGGIPIPPPPGSNIVSYLIVGGGGGGGGNVGGGGGGGGVQSGVNLALSPGSYPAVLGGGGAGGAVTGPGGNGGGSGFDGMVASGGGGGGSSSGAAEDGSAGASGGGAGYDRTVGGTVGGTTAGTGRGSLGGNVPLPATGSAAGGGGATGAGSDGTNSGGPGNQGTALAGNGGAGFASSISGSSVTYGSGGGGGAQSTYAPAGGSGGSGAGNGAILDGGSGAVARGGGGGGGGFVQATLTSHAGGNGGSGIVIISYPTGSIVGATGGTITTSGGNTIHTFINNGTFVIPP